jgi:hypothetical protein
MTMRCAAALQLGLHGDHRQLDQVGRRALHGRVDGLALGAGGAAVAAVDLGQQRRRPNTSRHSPWPALVSSM